MVADQLALDRDAGQLGEAGEYVPPDLLVLGDHAVVGDAALHRARQVVGVDDVERAPFGALGGKVERAARRGRAVVADNDRSRGGGHRTAPESANAGMLITVMLGAKCMLPP